MTKNIIVGAIGILAVLGAATFFGYSPFLKLVTNVSQNFSSSPSGTTFNTAKFAGIVANMASPGANATSSSILNGDANDRFITSVDYGCEGVGQSNSISGGGLASLSFKVATTSTASPIALSNTNILNTSAFFIGTSTTIFLVASSTAGIGNTNSASSTLIWPTGTYLTFYTNATNTAVCTFGVKYIGS